jgi:WD40 repeat protein
MVTRRSAIGHHVERPHDPNLERQERPRTRSTAQQRRLGADRGLVTGRCTVGHGSRRTARIWDTDGGELAVLRGHDNKVTAVAWSPDGQRLVTGSGDRTVRIWDVESGTEIVIVGAHTKTVRCVSWSPDGRRVASASEDGTCRIWDATISFEDLVANARCRISWKLSAEERRNLMLPSTD